MRYRLVIFDFDGTLADSFPWSVRTLNGVADRYRFRRIEPEDLDLLRGRDAREIIAHLGIPSWKLPLIARRTRRLTASDREEIRPFPGVDSLLARLSEAGVLLAVMSSNSRRNVRHVLGPVNAARTLLGRHLAEVVAPEDVAEVTRMRRERLAAGRDVFDHQLRIVRPSGERRLVLRTRCTHDGVALHVVDSGPGIAPQHLERIFDPFFTTRDPGEGMGLGLSLVHNIVTEHGGGIHVASEVGKGADFRIELPRASGKRAGVAAGLRNP